MAQLYWVELIYIYIYIERERERERDREREREMHCMFVRNSKQSVFPNYIWDIAVPLNYLAGNKPRIGQRLDQEIVFIITE